MRILLTGATGFIGHAVARALLERGHSLRLVVRRPPPSDLLGPRTEVWQADLRDRRALQGCMEGMEAVVHVAGQLRGWRFRAFYDGNVRATQNLLQEVAAPLRRFVYFSSLAAQGPLHPETGRPLGPVSHYGRSKRLAEEAIRRRLPEPSWVFLRPGVVYGPGDRALLPFFRWLLRHRRLPVPARPRRLGLVYVEDLVAFTLWALEAPEAAGRTFCITGPEAPSVSEILQQIARTMGRDLHPVPLPGIALKAAGLLGALLFPLGKPAPWINPDKLREARQEEWRCVQADAWHRAAGLRPTPLEEGLRRTLAFYRQAHWL